MPTLNEVNVKLNEIFKKKQVIINELQYLYDRRRYLTMQLEQSSETTEQKLAIMPQQSTQNNTKEENIELQQNIGANGASNQSPIISGPLTLGDIYIPPSVPTVITSLTSAQIYSGQAPSVYLMDRDGRASRLLRAPEAALTDLCAKLVQEDQLELYNGARSTHISNASGLGGVHGPKNGFGSRFVSSCHFSRFKDELLDAQTSGLEAQDETDTQFTRVNQAEMTQKMLHFQSLRGKQTGIVSLNRLIQEEYCTRLRSAGDRISLKSGGWRGYGPVQRQAFGLLNKNDKDTENDENKDNTNIENKVINAIFGQFDHPCRLFPGFGPVNIIKRSLLTGKQIRDAIMARKALVLKKRQQSRFYKDLAYINAINDTQNPYFIPQNATDFSETPGFVIQEKFNEEFKPLLVKCVQNYGKWSLTTLPAAKRNIDQIDTELALLTPVKGKM